MIPVNRRQLSGFPQGMVIRHNCHFSQFPPAATSLHTQYRCAGNLNTCVVAGAILALCVMVQARAKILCIEDDPEAATLLAGELLDRGFEGCVAHNAQEGFVAILRWVPDLVVCDISMPAASSFEVVARLTKVAPRFRRMPFVFLTAPTDRECELKGRQLGADDYVAKPIDFDRLTAIITARLASIARRNVSSKSVALNERQIEVLTWAARGNTSAEIAQLLGLSKRTVDFHMDNARTKLGATTRIEAVTKAVSRRLIEPHREYPAYSGRLRRQRRRMGPNR